MYFPYDASQECFPGDVCMLWGRVHKSQTNLTLKSRMFCMVPYLRFLPSRDTRVETWNTRHTDTHLNVMHSPSQSQVGHFRPPDDKKPPNIEGLDVVSIETDLMRKGHCQVSLRKKQEDYRSGGVIQEHKTGLLFIFIHSSFPSTDILTMIQM